MATLGVHDFLIIYYVGVYSSFQYVQSMLEGLALVSSSL